MSEDLVVAVFTFLGVTIPAYFLFRSEIAKVKAAAEAEKDKLKAEIERIKAERQTAVTDDRRDDFRAVTDVLKEQVKQLQETVTYLRKVADSNESKILDLTRENGSLREKVVVLEGYVQSIVAASELRCPTTGEPCILRSIIRSRGMMPADGEVGREERR